MLPGTLRFARDGQGGAAAGGQAREDFSIAANKIAGTGIDPDLARPRALDISSISGGPRLASRFLVGSEATQI
jgi:hypothetical protein